MAIFRNWRCVTFQKPKILFFLAVLVSLAPEQRLFQDARLIPRYWGNMKEPSRPPFKKWWILLGPCEIFSSLAALARCTVARSLASLASSLQIGSRARFARSFACVPESSGARFEGSPSPFFLSFFPFLLFFLFSFLFFLFSSYLLLRKFLQKFKARCAGLVRFWGKFGLGPCERGAQIEHACLNINFL